MRRQQYNPVLEVGTLYVSTLGAHTQHSVRCVLVRHSYNRHTFSYVVVRSFALSKDATLYYTAANCACLKVAFTDMYLTKVLFGNITYVIYSPECNRVVSIFIVRIQNITVVLLLAIHIYVRLANTRVGIPYRSEYCCLAGDCGLLGVILAIVFTNILGTA